MMMLTTGRWVFSILLTLGVAADAATPSLDWCVSPGAVGLGQGGHSLVVYNTTGLMGTVKSSTGAVHLDTQAPVVSSAVPVFSKSGGTHALLFQCNTASPTVTAVSLTSPYKQGFTMSAKWICTMSTQTEQAAVAGSTVVLPSRQRGEQGAGVLGAFDASTGAALWNASITSLIHFSVASGYRHGVGAVVVTYMACPTTLTENITVFKASDGTVQEQLLISYGAKMLQSPTIQVYSNATLVSLNGISDTGAQIEQVVFNVSQSFNPVLYQGDCSLCHMAVTATHVYLVDQRSNRLDISAFSLSTGSRAWIQSISGATVSGSVVLSTDESTLFFLYDVAKMNLVAFSTSSGKQLWSVATTLSATAGANPLSQMSDDSMIVVAPLLGGVCKISY